MTNRIRWTARILAMPAFYVPPVVALLFTFVAWRTREARKSGPPVRTHPGVEP
jgi:hypothetical protein